MNPTDAELIKGIIDRDTSAFDTLYARYVEKIRSRVRRMVREEGLVQDLVQEAFLVLARAMCAENPGIVFANAAAAGEIDPLQDVDSRLFVGLNPL
ncbi:MAG: hypothetical protein V3S89_09785 [Desulfobacterales bacterium]